MNKTENRQIAESSLTITAVLLIVIIAIISVIAGRAQAAIYSFSNMAPGHWTEPVEYTVRDKHTGLPFKNKLFAIRIKETQPGLFHKMNIRVRRPKAGKPGKFKDWPIVYEGSLHKMNYKVTKKIATPLLGTNLNNSYYFEFQLDASAGNEYQGKSLVFEIPDI